MPIPQPDPSARKVANGPAVDRNRIITFSTAPDRYVKKWRTEQKPLDAWLAFVTALDLGRKGDGRVWSPAIFQDGRRNAAAVLRTQVLPLDSDAGHTSTELAERFRAVGWYARIVPTSSWGSTVSDVSADHYDRWAADVKRRDGDQADTGPERYLVEQLHKVPDVAKGAVIEGRFTEEGRDKANRRTLKPLVRIRHQPCEKYRILCVLSEGFDLSTTDARRAWKKFYDAAIDAVGLPLDRTCGSPERLFFLSRLPKGRLEAARPHVRTVEGSTVVLAELPPPKPRVRTRRGPASFAGEHVRGRGADDEEIEYYWTDPATDRTINLRAWARTGMAHLPLADLLLQRGWTPDDRGDVDGKLHIECPFEGQHSSGLTGGTYVSNAADFAKTGTVDRQPGAIIHCSHNGCRDRDRLEFITEFLRAGALTLADLDAAREEAKAEELAADFEPVEDATGRPLFAPAIGWTAATIRAHLSALKRLERDAPDRYAELREAWDALDTVPADELDLRVDLAPDEEPPPAGPAGGAPRGPSAPSNWRNQLHRNEKGLPTGGSTNLQLALEYGLNLAGAVGFNLLKQRLEIRDPSRLPWYRPGEGPRPWTDHDDTEAACRIEGLLPGVQVKPHTVTPIIEALGARWAFHPVRDYLDSLAWDGVPRIDRLLIDYAGAEDTPFVQAVTARTLIAGCARAYRPGCKVDTGLFLESGQGFKKSTLFSVLAGEPSWFTDNLPGALGDKVVAEVVSSHWIIEIGELTSVKKGEIDKTKAFMSRQVDTYRPAYGRRPVSFPRQCLFVGTVNQENTGYLRDLTGNRRFWIVGVGRVDLPAIARLRDQIWAEARVRFQAGERWWIEDSEEPELAEAQQDAALARTEEPHLQDTLARFIGYRPGVSGYDRDNSSQWTPRREPLTVIPSLASFYNAIGIATKDIQFRHKVDFKQAAQALGWRQYRVKDRGKPNPIGLLRDARYFVAPEGVAFTGPINVWLEEQVKKGAVCGMEPVEDTNIIDLHDHKVTRDKAKGKKPDARKDEGDER